VDSILVVNAGSSSLKLALLSPAGDVTAAMNLDHWDGEAGHDELRDFLAGQREVAAVGHRVVHGGPDLTQATVIDEPVLAQIKALTDLAPLHQPRALAAITAARALLPHVPQVACFDTAFHATLPAAARAYALPAAWTQRYGLRRYGFHGLSHAYAARRCAQLLDIDPQQLRVVTCHLGAGSSLAAVSNGVSVDTTMGFTPLDGLVMATRPGSVDPGLLVWLLARGDLSLDQVSDGLEHAAGLAGLARLPDGSGDLREVRLAAEAGSAPARLAVDVHTHRLRREIAAMAAAMNGLDALVFTGGIGERSVTVRRLVLARLGFLGLTEDPEANAAHGRSTGGRISRPGPVQALVVPTDEELMIARDTARLIAALSASHSRS
jgi:acetate kinase